MTSAAAERRLEAAIEPGAALLLDTSVVIAYLTGGERVSPLAEQVFDAFLASGRNVGAISSVTAGEVLVRPFRFGAAAVATAEGFLAHFADMRLVPVDYPIVREAARTRAATGLAMPDAIVIASALVSGFDVLVTNDGRWRSPLEAVAPELRLCVLDAVLTGP